MPHVAATVPRAGGNSVSRTASTAGSRLPKAVRDAERVYAAGYTVFAHPRTAVSCVPQPVPALAPMHRIVPAQAAADAAPRALAVAAAAAALRDERMGTFSRDGTLQSSAAAGANAGGGKGGILKTKSARGHGALLSRRDSRAAPPAPQQQQQQQPQSQQQQPTLAEGGLGAVGRMKSLRVSRPQVGGDSGIGSSGSGCNEALESSNSGGNDSSSEQEKEGHDALLIDRIAEPERAETWSAARPRLSAVYTAGDSAAVQGVTQARGALQQGPAAQISVEVQSLQFDACDVEPLFGTLFLYNRTAGTVASEPFSFCVARDHVNLTVGLIGDMRSRATAVFTVPLPSSAQIAASASASSASAQPQSPQTLTAGSGEGGSSNSSGSGNTETETTLFEEYLVLRVDKIAQDDTLTAVADAYSRPRGSLGTAAVDDLRKRVVGAAAGQTRPFAHETLAWSCIPLIRYRTARARTAGSPGYLCVDEGQQAFSTFFRHVPSEPDMVALVVAGGGRKAAQLRGSCEVIVSDLGDRTPLHDNLSAAGAAHATLFLDPAGRRLVIGGAKAEEGEDAKHSKTKTKKAHKHKKAARKAAAGEEGASEAVREDDKEEKEEKKEEKKEESATAPQNKKHKHKDSRSSAGSEATTATESTEVAKAGTNTEGESPAKEEAFERIVQVLRPFDGGDTDDFKAQNTPALSGDSSTRPKADGEKLAHTWGTLRRSMREPRGAQTKTAATTATTTAGAAGTEATTAKPLSLENLGYPYTEGEHMLFVSVKQLTLANVGSSLFKQTRVFVKAELVEDDAENGAQSTPLECFVDNFDIDKPFKAATEACTCVSTMASKAAFFTDIIKVLPPAGLKPNMFLLFTVLKKKEKTAVPVGYAFTPLLFNGALASGNNCVLPVESARPKALSTAYSKFVAQQHEGDEQPRSTLKLSLKWCTTFYSPDVHMQRFLSSLDDTSTLSKTLETVASASPKALVAHLYVVLNELFGLMRASRALEYDAFLATIKIINALKRSSPAQWEELLNTYTQEHFSPASFVLWELEPGSVRRPLHTVISHCWSKLMREDAEMADVACSFAWFLFAVMVKSIQSLAVANKGSKRAAAASTSDGAALPVVVDSDVRKELSDDSFMMNLKGLVVLLRRRVASKDGDKLSATVCDFCLELFSVLDRGQVCAIIDRFVSKDVAPATDSVAVRSKFAFLRRLVQYENYVALNLLLLDTTASSTKDQRGRTGHFLVDMFLRQIDTYSSTEYSEDSRVLCLTTLQDALVKHDTDQRYNSNDDIRTAIADMYLPFLDTVQHHSEFYDSSHAHSSARLRRLAMFCLAWILKNCSRQKLVDWLDSGGSTEECQAKTRMLLEAITCCIKTFRCGQRTAGSVTPRTEGQQQGPAVFARAPVVSAQQQVDSQMMESYLNVELSLVALDVLELVNTSATLQKRHSAADSVAQEEGEGNGAFSVLTLFNITTGLLGTLLDYASTRELVNQLYSFLHKYVAGSPVSHRALFCEDNANCGTLCRIAVRHCNSPDAVVRANAVAFLYFMIVHNYSAPTTAVAMTASSTGTTSKKKSKLNFNRMKIQMMKGMSKLGSQGIRDFGHIQRALETLKKYNELQNGRSVSYEEWCKHNNRTPRATSEGESPSPQLPLVTVTTPVIGVSAPPQQQQQQQQSASVNRPPATPPALPAELPKTTPVLPTEQPTDAGWTAGTHDDAQQVPRVAARTTSARRISIGRRVSKGTICSPASETTSSQEGTSTTREKKSSSNSSTNESECGDEASGEHYVYYAFGTEIVELVRRLKGILRDGEKLNRVDGDEELRADLFWSIANSYTSVPAIRLAWLDSLFQHNKRLNLQIEAAHTLVLECAFVAEYLYARAKRADSVPAHLPHGYRAFRAVAPAVCDEARVSTAALDDESAADTDEFSERGLLALMERALHCLRDAELHEEAYRLSLLLMPLYDHLRLYEKLRNTVIDLGGTCQRIVECQRPGDRQLGSYYRVGLYGLVFGEQNGREYVVRFLKLARLAEVSRALTAMFGACLRDALARTGGAVLLYRDTAAVPESLRDDPANAHIQLTSVAPFFGFEDQERARLARQHEGLGKAAQLRLAKELESLPARETLFEKATNIDCFMFETPFTRADPPANTAEGEAKGEDKEKEKGEGRRDDDTAKQWKRKTFLFVEKAMPFVKQRMPVVRREQLELTPIENAIEAVSVQNARLRAELRASEPSLKALQPLLQGSCLVMVQKGPIEGICNTFLAATLAQWPAAHVALLCALLEHFLRAVEDALRLHERIVPAEMLPLHRELVAGYTRMNAEMSQVIAHARDVRGLTGDSEASAAAAAAASAAACSAQPGVVLAERIVPAPQYRTAGAASITTSSGINTSGFSSSTGTASVSLVRHRGTASCTADTGRRLRRRQTMSLIPQRDTLDAGIVEAPAPAPASARHRRPRAGSDAQLQNLDNVILKPPLPPQPLAGTTLSSSSSTSTSTQN